MDPTILEALGVLPKQSNSTGWWESQYSPDIRGQLNGGWQLAQLDRILNTHKDDEDTIFGIPAKQGEYRQVDGAIVPRRPTPDATGKVSEYDFGTWTSILELLGVASTGMPSAQNRRPVE